MPDPRDHSPLRRLALKTTACLAALWALPATARAFLVDRFQTRQVEDDDFRFDPATGLVRLADGAQAPYSLTISGLVDRPRALSYAELRALPAEDQTSDLHCVEGWSVPDAHWRGVRPAVLARLAGVRPEATHVVFRALGHIRGGPLDRYVESLPLAEALDPALRILLALDLDGAPLPHERGAPLRLVAPYDLAYKGIKFVDAIEFTDHPVDGWWTAANPIYPRHAPVPAARLRAPGPRRDGS